MDRPVLLSALLFSTLLLTAAAPAPLADIDVARAAQIFAEAEELSAQDGGTLWGHPLYARLLFVDPAAGQIVANGPDTGGTLVEQGGVWVGPRPEAIAVANTAQVWQGELWTTVIWPLPDNGVDRRSLLAHEMYHRIQPDLGRGTLPAADNVHLDTGAGRGWLRLEFRALGEALILDGSARRRALCDALLFRAARHASLPGARDAEVALESNEGLAEYTGLKLCGLPEERQRDRAAARLARDEQHERLTRSFAYASGPAYGLLLDMAGAGAATAGTAAGSGSGSELESGSDSGSDSASGSASDSGSGSDSGSDSASDSASAPATWRSAFRGEADFAALAAAAYGIELPADAVSAARERLEPYDGEAVLDEEAQRDLRREQRVAVQRTRFVDGPVLLLPASGDVQFSFDPNGVESLPGIGQIYDPFDATDAWGTLAVAAGGALVLRDEQGRVAGIRVPAPELTDAAGASGDGWTLTLAAGWVLADGERAGDFVLRRQ